MNELALFAGAGGGILGGALLGWTTVGAVEIEKYPRECLLQRQRDGLLPPFPVWDDVCTFNGKPWRGLVDIISGGFPCQDISSAGKGAGITGARSGLWKEMHRIICEVRPRYAFMENSPMLTSRGLGVVLGDLVEAGYNAAWLVLGAADVGAPHLRKRIWILAEDTQRRNLLPHPELHRAGRRQQQPQSTTEADCRKCNMDRHADSFNVLSQPEVCGGTHTITCGICADVPDTMQQWQGRQQCSQEMENASAHTHLPGCKEQRKPQPTSPQDETAQCCSWWSTEPNVGRVAHGVASRVDRLKAIGNGQVPLVAATAFLKLQDMLHKS